MRKVFFSRLAHLLTLDVLGHGSYARANQGLTAEEGGVGSSMGDHDHVFVVDAIGLVSVHVFLLPQQLPVQGQILEREQVVFQLLYFPLPVSLVHSVVG